MPSPNEPASPGSARRDARLRSLASSLALPAGIAACALVFVPTVGPWHSLRGIAGPTLALSERPVQAALYAAVALAVSVAIAGAVGRAVNAVVGMFALGCGVSILAMRGGTIEDLAFSAGSVRGMAIESLVWMAAILAAAFAVFRIAGPLPDAVEIEDERIDGPLGRKAFLALAAAPLALVGVWLLALSPAKGQALAGVVAGSMLAALAGRLIAPRTPPILLFAAPCLAAALGQFVVSTLLPAEVPLGTLFVARAIPRVAYPMPLDWAAAGTVGIALGIGWSRSFLKVEPGRRPRRR